ncbi:coiled-coil domain-containing protein 103 [Thalassophryne amazonica]|uniref:coiled-coil domain-containing protein 103 n=1 Tax=Thalassophryne amazonica TaxID=390379 RepID=UPI0014723970|nr:coiled-coil domain-containing protein 103 [Thalassophryne amazonica]
MMANSQRDIIDFTALEKELRMVVEIEQKYCRQNDAKLRAVSQKVKSYQEFRDLVLACHMKPLHKNDKEGGPHKQPWNPLVAPDNKHHMTSD